MKSLPPIVLWAVALAMIGTGGFWTAEANRRDYEQTQNILSMQSQMMARHVNPRKPEYSAHFQRIVAGNPRHLRVLLYDLSGWEIGRPAGSTLSLPLNDTAARMAFPSLLSPRHDETPLEPFKGIPDFVANEPRLYNRHFATNIIGAAWIAELPSSGGDRWLVATTSVNDYDELARRSYISAWLQAAMRLSDALRPLHDRWIVFGGFTALLLALTGGWHWWSLRQIRALHLAADTAERLELNQLASTRFNASTGDPDSQRLLRACNRLLERVTEVHLAQQRFVADAAHELRTPLTILRGEIQVALREPGNHPFLVQTLRSNLDECVHLSRLVESLLTLARSDAGQVLAVRQPVDLAALVKQTLAKLEPLASQRHVLLQFNPDTSSGADWSLSGDAVALDRVVFNLIENAILHSPENHPVSVTLAAKPGTVSLEVADQGIGIAPEHLPKLFDRFYRVDAARRRADGGAGLGLAIVKTLVEAHGGTVHARSEIGVGSSFTVELPRAARVG
ncbi:MAG: hypothetical protein IPK15_01780 [Verrucomicrobia bacterium]|nr:hypothetical protein [Verrucomicrobiota bacterium]